MDKIIIENFKIFEGEHIFDLRKLNIFTGANNSGKSTLIKAISLFAKGLEKGDFPDLNLLDPENKTGEFQSLVNINSEAKEFKIGFYVNIGDIETPFKVLYSFANGDTDGNWRLKNGFASFVSLEIYNNENVLFCGIYDANLFNVNEGNIEFEPYNEYTDNINRLEHPFKVPYEGGECGVLFIKFDLVLLEKYISGITNEDFSELILHLKNIKGNNNFWWVELFDEVASDLIEHNISTFKFDDLIEELKSDKYHNIADYELKEILLNYETKEEEEKKYNDLIIRTNYKDFIEEVVGAIFKCIGSGLDSFKENNVLHIVFQEFNKRLIPIEQKYNYLQKAYRFALHNRGDLQKFIEESLDIFGIDGKVEIIEHLNTSFEINLVTAIQKTKKELEILQKKLKNELYLYDYSLEHFTDNPRINITDLGKGTANLIGLILKTGSILSSIKKEKNTNVDFREKRGLKKKQVSNKTILIEEPEAFLHPDWQSKLIDFFVYCLSLNQSGLTFIIETHSEYLIRKLQYLTAKKEIKPEDSILYYFHHPDHIPDREEQIKKLKIREDGMMDSDFGPGFFDESIKLTVELLKLQNKN